jgi:succinyl-CoA synthetase beta subunit
MPFLERIAHQNQLRYIAVEGGNIGVISNGAGYCMATNDLLS